MGFCLRIVPWRNGFEHRFCSMVFITETFTFSFSESQQTNQWYSAAAVQSVTTTCPIRRLLVNGN